IYAKASRVVIWLGDAQADSDLALEAIRSAAEEPGARTKMPQIEEQAIRQLLKRLWFRRI
ncbi:hypothetical protein B0O99DRAFT_506091, partial [Bisporella sp. PMI_857]